ncbi:hypothetical protein RB620_06250 [Paenibacillus sp. LHD-117]|uniref:hypothetical protein n=1 Tax=Paenibacillus sp. LHD-117 TaxID=3071412 RepID=UPI0027E1BE98|nr:hypothetical protein [Paenibacillus sp. LHD-117]MDQ6419036.1 hypothetical protein [Paenibacillus sp. LHD-117]
MKRNKQANMRGRLGIWLSASALALLIAGCQNAAPGYVDHDDSVIVTEEVTSEGPQKSYLDDDDVLTAGNETVAGEGGGALDGDSSAEASSVKKGESGKSNDGKKSKDGSWSEDVPSLHGIAIGDKTAAVSKLLGKELDSYELEEEVDRIKVNEYEGLSVGFNQKGAVHFVEVYGHQTSAGLNGLKIGDKPDQALQKLGKPESQTDYLLTYAAEGALLKLDIDPGVNEIVSMKLIARS